MPMKARFRLIHRGERGNQFYCVDSETGRRFSLKTKDRDAAQQIVLAKNQSLRQQDQLQFVAVAGGIRASPSSTPLRYIRLARGSEREASICPSFVRSCFNRSNTSDLEHPQRRATFTAVNPA